MLWGNTTHQYYEAAMGYTNNSDFKWGIYKERGWNDKHLITYTSRRGARGIQVEDLRELKRQLRH